MPRPSMTGYLWTNGATILVDSAYNSGVTRVLDYIDAHVHNTTIGGQVADQHSAGHIVSVTPTIGTASSDATTDVGARLSQIANRINLIEGTGAGTWGSGSAPTTLNTINDAIAAHTIVAAPPTSIDWSTVATVNTISVNKFHVDWKVVPGGSPLRTVVKAASGYNAATGTAHFTGDQTVTHPSTTVGMTAGQSRYDAVSLDANSNAVLTPGTPASSPQPAGTPVGQKVLAYVLLPYNTDGTLIPASNIVDVRGNQLVEGGGSGGGTALNHPYAGIGTGVDVTTPSVDIPTVLAGGYLGTGTTVNGIGLSNIYIHTDMVKDVVTDATLGDLLDGYATQNLMALIRSGISGATVTIGADANNQVPIAIQGRRRKITGPITATASGGAGVRYLIASCAATGVATWTISLSSSPAVAAFQQVLAVLWWDSGSLQAGNAIDFSQLFSAPSTSTLMEGAQCIGTLPAAGYPSLTGSSAWQAISGIPSSIFYLPKPATTDVRLAAAWVQPTASSSNQFRVVIDTVPEGLPIFVPPSSAGGNMSGFVSYRRASKIAAGIHSVTIQAFVTTGQSLGVITDNCNAYLDFSY